ncbi:hypothetical protein EI94DRAFT_1804013 [Lactarius quietus]|nr:hypothetical protein EI94DRAFT_1804013 [Lactarius quietus]
MGMTAVAQEVATVADQEALDDLFNDIKEYPNVGKSTMGRNILFQSGTERSKGETVEVGRAYFETKARRYIIFDAPAHKTFVPSKISGAAQADVALLVISARKGEFETGFEKAGRRASISCPWTTPRLEEEVNIAVSEDNVRIRLRGAVVDDISPGFVLTSFKPGYLPVMHVHTLAEEVTLSALLHYFDKTMGAQAATGREEGPHRYVWNTSTITPNWVASHYAMKEKLW